MSQILTFSGSHAEVGRQAGLACRDILLDLTADLGGHLPAGRSLEEQLALADRYAAVTRNHLPWLMIELDHMAQASGVDPRVLFAVTVEEIWPNSNIGDSTGKPLDKGCTDVIADGTATADGQVIVGHNNDLLASAQKDIRAIEWRVDSCPTVLSIGVGPFHSVAFNSAGLSMTGNALSPNDEKIGLPRLLLATAVSRCETIDEAAAMAEHVQRASSYNWVLADRHGAAVSIEGSATNAVHLKPDSRGVLHHENHYADPAMARYELRNDVAERSRARGRRMDELLAHMRVGQLSPRSLRTLLSDHSNSPESICRHVTEEDRQQTVFWTVAEPASNAVTFGIGQPCNSTSTRYTFH